MLDEAGETREKLQRHRVVAFELDGQLVDQFHLLLHQGLMGAGGLSQSGVNCCFFRQRFVQVRSVRRILASTMASLGPDLLELIRYLSR